MIMKAIAKIHELPSDLSQTSSITVISRPCSLQRPAVHGFRRWSSPGTNGSSCQHSPDARVGWEVIRRYPKDIPKISCKLRHTARIGRLAADWPIGRLAFSTTLKATSMVPCAALEIRQHLLQNLAELKPENRRKTKGKPEHCAVHRSIRCHGPMASLRAGSWAAAAQMCRTAFHPDLQFVAWKAWIDLDSSWQKLTEVGTWIEVTSEYFESSPWMIGLLWATQRALSVSFWAGGIGHVRDDIDKVILKPWKQTTACHHDVFLFQQHLLSFTSLLTGGGPTSVHSRLSLVHRILQDTVASDISTAPWCIQRASRTQPGRDSNNA